MKIKFILAKLLHNWSNNLDENILKKLGYYHIIKWYSDIKHKATVEDHETVIQKLSTIYSNLIENGLVHSHLSKLVKDKIQEVEKELNQPKEENLTSDQILQNALDKGKKAHDKHLKDKSEKLEYIHKQFIQKFKEEAFDKNYQFSMMLYIGIDINTCNIENYLKEKVDFLKKCILMIESGSSTKSIIWIKVKYKG